MCLAILTERQARTSYTKTIMTHDFAKKPKPAKSKKKAQKTPIPSWVWLLIGVVAGVFLSFLGYLTLITPEPASATIAAKVDEIKEDVKNDVATKFDFYTLLPEREVIVPIDHEEADTQPRQATIYILQAGSFRSASDRPPSRPVNPDGTGCQSRCRCFSQRRSVAPSTSRPLRRSLTPVESTQCFA